MSKNEKWTTFFIKKYKILVLKYYKTVYHVKKYEK
jgi:hypothetical protein